MGNEPKGTMDQSSALFTMMRKPSSIERIEAQARRRQEIAFCVLTQVVIAALLLLHTYFASLLGEPSRSVILILFVAFSAKSLETIWLWSRRDGVSEKTARIETVLSIPAIFVLAGVLAVLTDRDDAPYFVLLAIPILQCAYRFGLLATLATIVASIGMIFAWAQHFFALHPPARPTELLEAGMISVIYCLIGLLVWYLVHQLEQNQAKLYENMMELEATRDKLAIEERLAAVERLASGIAHEIRNPVAMIASALSTASYPGADTSERDEMFAIAAREAKRLEVLTVDFLSYAHPSPPQRSPYSIADILRHVVNMTRVRASERGIQVDYASSDELTADIDPSQVEGALVNLGFNAVDATPDRGRIAFRTEVKGWTLFIEVENTGCAIAETHLLRIFEPFFTTKPRGTGLGLAIARAAAQAHGGDLWVSKNENGAVAFTMTILIGADREQNWGAQYG
jgi:signal transduction histidine kinase